MVAGGWFFQIGPQAEHSAAVTHRVELPGNGFVVALVGVFQDVHVVCGTLRPHPLGVPDQLAQLIQSLIQGDAPLLVEGFVPGRSRLRGPPVNGALLDAAIFLAFQCDPGIVKLVIVTITKWVKRLCGDCQDSGIWASAQTFQVDHQVHADKGFGQAMGPDAGNLIKAVFSESGFQVHCAPTPWQLDGKDAAMVDALISGISTAVAQHGEIDSVTLEEWTRFRKAHLETGTCVVGHTDLLALPNC